MNTIDSFQGKYRFLSNFYPSIIVYEGITYPTNEHFYQAMKTINEEQRLYISRCSTPGEAKKAGKKVELRPNWDELKDDIMRWGLELKFQDPMLRAALLATGDAMLIEGNTWGDTYWGVCDGKGENHLGIRLMKVRREIQLQKENAMKIMGTGSRSLVKAPDRKEVFTTLQRYILSIREDYSDILLISGLAEGWDEAIAKVGLDNSIPYLAVLPTRDYGNYYWGQHSQLGRNRIARFNELVQGALEVVHLEDIYGEPKFLGRGQGMPGPNYWVDDHYIHANFLRNQVMVDMCDGPDDMALVYNAQSAGTKDAVARLKLAQKRYEIYPFITQGELAL